MEPARGKQEPPERVEVTICLPKKALDFLEANKDSLECQDVGAYITLGVLRMIRKDLGDGAMCTEAKEAIEYELKD